MIIPPKTNNRICGVYAIVNTVNGHRYVGSAVNIKKRWEAHKNSLCKGTHHSRYLQRAWNKYGADCFGFSVIEHCDKSLLIVREQFHIDAQRPEYNISPTAGSPLGVKHSEKARRNMSEAHKGKVTPTKTRIILSEIFKGRVPWSKGKHLSEETKRKLSEINKGKLVSEEHRRNISRALMGNKNGCGHVPTLEKRQKISASNKGKIISEETRKKISNSLIGRVSPKKGIKTGITWHHTEEARKKISEARKKREEESRRAKQ
jgi:group I intron endonuclease